MSTRFKCTACGYNSKNIDASFTLGMQASITYDGKQFRQSEIRVADCSLTEDLSGVVCKCSSCGASGSYEEQFSLVLYCDNCLKVYEKDEVGFCGYDATTLCEKCFKKAEPVVCNRCSETSRCDLYSKFGEKKNKSSSRKNTSEESELGRINRVYLERSRGNPRTTTRGTLQDILIESE